MIHFGGAGYWFSAGDLAELKLPGLPGTKRKINELAEAQRWALRGDAAGKPMHRRRAGKGGGYEYHVGVLPQAASFELIRRGLTPAPLKIETAPIAESCRDSLWAWFDGQTQTVKTEAERRLTVVNAVEGLITRTGATVTSAIGQAAETFGVSVATIHVWRGLVKGARPDDCLPRLAPRRTGGGATAEIDDGAWQFFLSAYLRPEKPTLTNAYDALIRDYATPRGLKMPVLKSFQRRMEREVDARVIISRRQGDDALRGTIPSQQRSVADLHALKLVNIDGHRWDVFVRWPDGTIARPMMVAIQDVYSRKMLAWRIGPTESALLTRLAFADLFRNHGIPEGCLLDNGRAFASKWITGGAKTRFRFKIREDEPTGLLPALAINVHWALPYRGSSKPIERGFKILCEHGAKDLVFAGAYTGNNTLAKPENYGETAIPLDVFTARIDQIIKFHNAKAGRRTEMARGRSYDDVWTESYQGAAIRKATEHQLKLALLTADLVTADRKTGEIRFMGNSYYTDALFGLRGQKVTIRFDPDNLHGDIHVYGPGGEFVATAPVQSAIGFLDTAAAKTRMKQEADLRRRTRELEQNMDLLSAQRLVELMPDDVDDEPQQPTPSVIRPVRASGRAVASAAAVKPARASMLDQMADLYAPTQITDRSHLRVVGK